MAGCRRRGLPVTLSGAGTGVTGGRVPQGGMIVSLERFRRLEIHNGFAIAGAGVSLKDVHEAAQAAGQFYPPDPTEWSASIGGTIATNASGSRSFHYGSTRKWVRLVKAVLADGTVRTFHRGDQVDFPFTPRLLANPQTYRRLPCVSVWIGSCLLCGSEALWPPVVEAKLSLRPSPHPPETAIRSRVSSHRQAAPSPTGILRAIPRNAYARTLRRASVNFSGPATRGSIQCLRALLLEQQLDSLPATLSMTGSNASTMQAPSANSLVRRNGPDVIASAPSAKPCPTGERTRPPQRLPERFRLPPPGRGQQPHDAVLQPAIDENLHGATSS